MPSKTERQAGFMRLCSSSGGRAKARGKCPPKEVAKEFVRADQAKKEKKAKR